MAAAHAEIVGRAPGVGCARMERYVAFLRGMNLGNRRIKNEELRAEFEAMGFEEVATFRASGNVIFAAPEKSESATDRGRSKRGSARRSATK